jgi:bifunctional non-homologous end joining protein LigD
VASLVIDGEAVHCRADGVLDFDALQSRRFDAVATLYAFDLLELDGADVFRLACEMGLEGIVSKRADLPYRSGRSKAWIKVKNPAAMRIEEGTWAA